MHISTKYRPEIDGLRSLAVLPVVFFHAGFSAFSGGYIGVDIFFVISGYLITGIIQREISSQTFSIVNFYERRARRILPALLFVSLCCIPFAYFWMLPFELESFFDSLIAINLFSSNFLFWRESEYFSAAAELKPLLHTWSLSVEEQFYVLFPVFLLLVNKFKHSFVLLAVIIVSLISFLIAEYASTHFPTANFYLLPSRFWELGLGAILAITSQYWLKVKSTTAQLGSMLGLIGLTFSIFYFDGTTPFPSRWSLIPVLSTALIVAFSRPENLIGKVLSWKPLVGIGLISYSTYLWHQPLFAFARIRMIEAPSESLYLILILSSLLLGYLTWYFIEAPFRNKQWLSRKQIFTGSAVFISVLIGVGIYGHSMYGIFNLKQFEAAKIQVWRKDYNPKAPECHADPDNYISPKDACSYNGKLKNKIAIWGDSHALGLAHILAGELKKQKYDLLHLTYSACIPAIGLIKTDEPTSQCTKYNNEVLDFLSKTKEIEIVVMHGRWPLYLEGSRFDNQEGGVEYGAPAYVLPLKKTVTIKSKERIKLVGKQYQKTINLLLKQGKKVVLVYSVPEAGWNVPVKLAREIIFELNDTGIKNSKQQLSTRFDTYKERVKATHQQLDLVLDNKNLIRVLPEQLFCNKQLENRCINQLKNGKPLYVDDNHLNSVGALLLSKKIILSLKERSWLKPAL